MTRYLCPELHPDYAVDDLARVWSRVSGHWTLLVSKDGAYSVRTTAGRWVRRSGKALLRRAKDEGTVYVPRAPTPATVWVIEGFGAFATKRAAIEIARGEGCPGKPIKYEVQTV